MNYSYKTLEWPVLKHYDGNHLQKIAMPLGGIGTGTVSLGGRGDLRDWEICNSPGKNFTPYDDGEGAPFQVFPFFAVHVSGSNNNKFSRILEGPLELNDYEGGYGCKAANHGFPRFESAEFDVAYPLAQILLNTPNAPVKVRLKAFNPLVPCDADKSGLPVALLSYEITNISDEDKDISVCGTIPNFIGDLPGDNYRRASGNVNKTVNADGFNGIILSAPELTQDDQAKGEIALLCASQGEFSSRTSWLSGRWGRNKLDFWNDFTDDGMLEERSGECNRPLASVCLKQKVKKGETAVFTFILSWRFPNRYSWDGKHVVGNYYATRYNTAWKAAVKSMEMMAELECETVEFVSAFCAADLPLEIKEATLFNLSTLRTETCFRTADGKFYGWEGIADSRGSCMGSCTHVWNYEQTLAYMFGPLAVDMRQTEFMYTTEANGKMRFRVDLPLDAEPQFSYAAADGQMGCLMKLYRDWQLSGDDAMLRELWPQARKALEFCWIRGGWDADRDGVMEGAQHNTMDVEYYGPNPQMGFWYLGALKCAEIMAAYLKDEEFAETCRNLFERGSKLLTERCFNGEYFEHVVEPPGHGAFIAEGLKSHLGSDNLDNPDLQLGAGCLVDQLVGQFFADIIDIGPLGDRDNLNKALDAIYRYNFKSSFKDHFNHLRSYAVGDEAGVLMATYPKGRRPEVPFPYVNEVMTGFEYTAAIGMIYAGMETHGLEIIRAIRNRFDGFKRNPFNEAECGHHYARAMAAWGAMLAMTGFHYSAVTGQMSWKCKNGTFFWSTGYAWGTCKFDGNNVELKVMHGCLKLVDFKHPHGCFLLNRELKTGDTAVFALN